MLPRLPSSLPFPFALTSLMRASNAGGVGRNRDIAILSQYLALLRAVNLTLLPARCFQYDAVGPPSHKLWHFAGSRPKWRCLLMAGKVGEMFMTRSFNVMPKTTEQHIIARSDKSVACVTNNKRLCSTFCTIEANYWHTRSIARPLCDSRATCIYFPRYLEQHYIDHTKIY